MIDSTKRPKKALFLLKVWAGVTSVRCETCVVRCIRGRLRAEVLPSGNWRKTVMLVFCFLEVVLRMNEKFD